MIKFRDLEGMYHCMDCGYPASASVLDYLQRRGELTPVQNVGENGSMNETIRALRQL